MKIGSIYMHIGNKNLYVIYDRVKLKNNQTRKWENGILYQEWQSGAFEKTMFVREERDFKKKFMLQES